MPDTPDRRPPRARAGDGRHDDDALTFDTRGRRPGIDEAQPIRQRPQRDPGPGHADPRYAAGAASGGRPGGVRPGGYPAYDDRGHRGYDDGGGDYGGGTYGAPTRRRGLRRLGTALLVLVLVWVVLTAWAVFTAWGAVDKVAATPGGNRPDSAGRNILLVGSDSREGLSRAQRARLRTGSATGARTDSIMLLHTGGDRPVLVSLPRDSYVEIPGHGANKINAAYSIGGPKLLAATVEHNTDLKVDGFMEIGFGGFASVVDSVDGVRMCLKAPMNDEKAHIDLPKGCQVLSGKEALGYVRARYSDPKGDLGRAERQRQFLGALMGKLVTPTNFLQPWKLRSLGAAGGEALTVGEDDGMIETARAFLALRTVAKGGGDSVTVPVSDTNFQTPAGSSVKWDDQKAKALWTALRTNAPLSIDPGDK